jgi:RimJ/RimL family protein N-acetyltransferase
MRDRGASLRVRQDTQPGDARRSGARQWRAGLPVLRNAAVMLRELRADDAQALFTHLASPSVRRYMAESPRSVEGFTRFIRWTCAQRRRGTHFSFGIVPAGESQVLGVVQIWPVESDFSTAEWGIACGEAVWGAGVSRAAATLLLEFAFERIGVMRLEARAVDANSRGNSMLRDLGATAEGRLRSGFRRDNAVMDHVMWSILAEEWNERREDGAGNQASVA